MPTSKNHLLKSRWFSFFTIMFFPVGPQGCNNIKKTIYRKVDGFLCHIVIWWANNVSPYDSSPKFFQFKTSSAKVSSALTSSSFTVVLIVTVFSIRVIFFICSNSAFIAFTALGAQDAFSISATLRFW